MIPDLQVQIKNQTKTSSHQFIYDPVIKCLTILGTIPITEEPHKSVMKEGRFPLGLPSEYSLYSVSGANDNLIEIGVYTRSIRLPLFSIDLSKLSELSDNIRQLILENICLAEVVSLKNSALEIKIPLDNI